MAETLEQMLAEITRLKQLVAQADATIAEGEEAGREEQRNEKCR